MDPIHIQLAFCIDRMKENITLIEDTMQAIEHKIEQQNAYKMWTAIGQVLSEENYKYSK